MSPTSLSGCPSCSRPDRIDVVTLEVDRPYDYVVLSHWRSWATVEHMLASGAKVLTPDFQTFAFLNNGHGKSFQVIPLAASSRILDIEAAAHRFADEVSAYSESKLGARWKWAPSFSSYIWRRALLGAGFERASYEAEAEIALEHMKPSSKVLLVGIESVRSACYTRCLISDGHTVQHLPEAIEPPASRRNRFLGLGRILRSPLRSLVANARSFRPPRSWTNSKRAMVCVGGAPHIRLLAPAVEALVQRGWDIVVLDMSGGRDLGTIPFGNVRCRLADLHAGPSPMDYLRYILARMRRTRLATEEIEALRGSECGILALNRWLVSQAFLEAPAALRAQSRAMRRLEPGVVLTIDESSLSPEVAALVARSHGIPVLNYQHGVIHRSARWEHMPFDRFLVWGEGYAEVLRDVGLDRRMIRVVGNTAASIAVQGTGNCELARKQLVEKYGLSIDPDSRLITFAAQYDSPRAGHTDFESYDSLKRVLQALDNTEGTTVLLKLHPLGRGRELGYEAALHEFGAARVVVSREVDLTTALQAADVVAVRTSTVAFEAIALDRAVVLVGASDALHRLPFVSEGVAVLVDDPTSVRTALLDTPLPIPDTVRSTFLSRYFATPPEGVAVRFATVVEDAVALRGRQVQ